MASFDDGFDNMIGFGELRKLSLQWQTDLSAVERAYALDWLLKGIFDREILQGALALRGAAALSKAYFGDYVQPEDVDLVHTAPLEEALLEQELQQAALETAHSSGLSFKLESAAINLARFEFTGPLGRRSAAQPHLILHLYSSTPRRKPVERNLLHPFSERWEATVLSVALEELAAERIAVLGFRPRARDVYDLWFILTHGQNILNGAEVRQLTAQITLEKGIQVNASLDPAYRPLLERGWENALKKVRPRPSFSQAESDITTRLGLILGG